MGEFCLVEEFHREGLLPRRLPRLAKNSCSLFGICKSPQPCIDQSPAPTGTQTQACLAVSQPVSNQVAGSQITAMGSCLKSFTTTGAVTGNGTRVSRLHVQRADH